MPQWLQHDIHPSLPAWLAAFRHPYKNIFLKHGLPTSKNESWKYADLNFIMKHHFKVALPYEDAALYEVVQSYALQHTTSILFVFVNGYFMPHLSSLSQLPQEALFTHLNDIQTSAFADVIQKHWPDHLEKLMYQSYPFAACNAAQYTDGLFFYLPDHCQLSVPIHLLSITTGTEAFVTHPHHVIVLGKNTQCTLLQEYRSLSQQPYMMNTVMNITLQEGAQLDYYKMQTENLHALHIAHTFVQQKQHSKACFTHLAKGGAFARDELIIHLEEQGAACSANGFYHLTQDHQYIDHQVTIHHAAPYSQSDMFYKGLVDKKSKAVFNGRLHVHKDAKKILAHQTNHNVLLSKEAEVYAKPELEIHADDVTCKHGATIGQLDQEALFYLCSRGIERAKAQKMLVQGFADDIWQRVKHAAIKQHMQEKLA
jgi:Fe-S cluster assembly protein SufD